MKKNIFLVLLCFMIMGLFTGCENFLDGKTFQEKVEEAINYANSSYHELDIYSMHGKISPNGTIKKKETDNIDLNFNADSDYQFIRWKAYGDKNKDTELGPEYITFDNAEEQNTSFKFNKALPDSKTIYIEPLCVKRPKVVSATPVYDTEGVYRDRKLVVMFDELITEETIYYSDSERAAVEKENSNSKVNWFEITKGTDKEASDFHTGKFYGYQLGDDLNSIVYKCISIVKLQNKSVNLLQYYGAPEFDLNNTGVLRLPAKSKSIFPPAATDILVNLTTDFGTHYTDASSGKKYTISMSGNYSWCYFTHSKYDNTPPVFEDDFEVKVVTEKISDEKKTYVTANKLPATDLFETESIFDVNAGPSGNNLKNYNISSKKLWLSGKITDGGSGPKSLSAKIKRVPNKYYPETSEETEILTHTSSLQIIGSLAEFKGENELGETGEYIDLSALTEEGMYEVMFTAIDKNDLSSELGPFYFIYDVTAPSSISELTSSRTEKSTESFSWKNSDVSDNYRIIAQRYFNDELQDEIEVFPLNSTNSLNFTKLTDQEKYKYRFYTCDIAGNINEQYSEAEDNTPPEKITAFNNSRTNTTKEYLSWTKPAADISYVKIERYLDSELEETVNVTGSNYEFTGLTNQTKYNYKFYTVDYSGNENSDYATYVDNTIPVKLTNFDNYRAEATKETLSWTKPATDIDLVKIERYQGSTLKETISTRNSSYVFTNLTDQTKYNYKFYTIDYSGNINTDYATYVDDTPPAKITIRYSEGRKGCANIFYTTPNVIDWSHATVSYGSSSGYKEKLSESTTKNKSTYHSFSGGTKGNSYKYYIRSYDFAGNYSDYVCVQEKTYGENGMICYAPGNSSSNIFCSMNYYSGYNPIGVICEDSNQSNIFIWGIGEVSGKPWGNSSSDVDAEYDLSNYYGTVAESNVSEKVNYAPGLLWYQYLNGQTDNHYKGSNSRTLSYDWSDSVWSNSIWNWCRNKNNNSACTWFIPGILEYKYILDNYDSMTSAYSTLASHGLDGTVIVQGDPYWVAAPRYWKGGAYAVEFNWRNTSDKCAWEYFTNSNSTLKRMWMTHTDLDYNTFKQSDTEESYVNIRAHAMAKIYYN